MTAALAFSCPHPRCRAPAGQRCTTPGGEILTEPHTARIALARGTDPGPDTEATVAKAQAVHGPAGVVAERVAALEERFRAQRTPGGDLVADALDLGRATAVGDDLASICIFALGYVAGALDERGPR